MKVRSTRAIGAMIRQRRLDLGLDQASLAAKIGASRYWLVQIEQGKDSAEIGRVLRVLEALGLSVDIGIPGERTARGNRQSEPKIPAFDIDAIVERAKRPPVMLPLQPPNRSKRGKRSKA